MHALPIYHNLEKLSSSPLPPLRKHSTFFIPCHQYFTNISSSKDEVDIDVHIIHVNDFHVDFVKELPHSQRGPWWEEKQKGGEVCEEPFSIFSWLLNSIWHIGDNCEKGGRIRVFPDAQAES
jgi:hypothetical protein